ncbi:E3 ubiquitin-protein ligase [Vairimorpha necatrix]|uniref:HECT-type E3 ubiquitin transferase n=1 Tax=Vairimorpha necatrix TaxID=6039 RepID=A0AAX4JA49_9MICR
MVRREYIILTLCVAFFSFFAIRIIWTLYNKHREKQVIQNHLFALSISRHYDDEIKIIKIEINRRNILRDSFECIMSKFATELYSRNRLFISFKDEVGFDESGITREWISLLIDEIFDPKNQLFYFPTDDCKQMSPVKIELIREKNLMYYRFLGRIMGRMIISKVNADVNLQSIVWKQLLDLQCDHSDFEKADPEFYKNFMKLKENPQIVIDLQTSFEEDGIEFIENGKNILVNADNINLYIEQFLKYKYITKIEKQVTEIKIGLFETINRNFLKDFSGDSFKLLIRGSESIDINNWIANTKYIYYNRAIETIKSFWEVVKSFSDDEKKLLLQFVTGSRYLPDGGLKNLTGNNLKKQKFTIMLVVSDNDTLLPSASTCTNTLKLPRYSSKKILKEKLLLAINECREGFDLS